MLPHPTDSYEVTALKLRLENLRLFIESPRYPLYRERVDAELEEIYRAWDRVQEEAA